MWPSRNDGHDGLILFPKAKVPNSMPGVTAVRIARLGLRDGAWAGTFRNRSDDDMDALTVAGVFSRWLHLITACVLIGSAFFLQVILPMGTRGLEPGTHLEIMRRCRRGFKMVVHSSLLLLLLTGAFNAWRAWGDYSRRPGITHGVFGIHVLLGLGALVLLLLAFAGREARPSRQSWVKVSLVLLFLAVAAASTLKRLREWAHDHPRADRISRVTSGTMQ
ncbi:MAG: hypothetical protein JWN51_4 [Phycisphaerales bacterium]|nr:hypothetical protein [Phycisphaerales bacterium]